MLSMFSNLLNTYVINKLPIKNSSHLNLIFFKTKFNAFKLVLKWHILSFIFVLICNLFSYYLQVRKKM